MNLILDTHILLWYVIGSDKLSAKARQIIDDPTNRLFLSPAVYWEIAIKASNQKLQLTLPYDQVLAHAMSCMSTLQLLPIEIRHTSYLLNLPFHHRDPFDRLLIAQSFVEGYRIVSNDTQFDAYSVPRIF